MLPISLLTFLNYIELNVGMRTLKWIIIPSHNCAQIILSQSETHSMEVFLAHTERNVRKHHHHQSKRQLVAAVLPRGGNTRPQTFSLSKNKDHRFLQTTWQEVRNLFCPPLPMASQVQSFQNQDQSELISHLNICISDHTMLMACYVEGTPWWFFCSVLSHLAPSCLDVKMKWFTKVISNLVVRVRVGGLRPKASRNSHGLRLSRR